MALNLPMSGGSEAILGNAIGMVPGTSPIDKFSILPPEILNFQILEQCDRKSLANLRSVNRHLEEIVTPVLFDSIALGSDHDHDDEVKRVQDLLESVLISHITSLSISSRIFKRDDETLWKIPGLREFIEKISHQLQNLTIIANHPEAVWDRTGYDIDLTSTAERFLWFIGLVLLEDISFPNLKSFNIHADCPRHIIRMIQTERPQQGVSWQYAARNENWDPTRALFPTIQHLGVHIALGEEEFEGAEYEYFEPAVRLLAFGCEKLTSLDVAIWEYTIRDDIHDVAQETYFDIGTTGINLSKLKRFSLRSGRHSDGAIPIRRMLKPMVNLEYLKLSKILTRPPSQEGNEDLLDVHNNWRHVFNLCREEMPKLKEFYFNCAGDDAYEEFAEEYGVPIYGYEERRWGKPTQEFYSCLKDEVEAFQSLKETVSTRRKELGLPEEW